MQRLWMVAICASAFVCSCADGQGLPGDLKVVQDGCTRAISSAEEKATDVAISYFHAEVGVAVSEIRTGYVSLCEDMIVVPVSARTDQVPTPNVWYVEISKSNYQPVELMRPM